MKVVFSGRNAFRQTLTFHNLKEVARFLGRDLKLGLDQFEGRRRQGPDGMLYVLTDESHGSLVRLEPTSDRNSPEAL